MKILSITAQKPHSTGSGTYMTELVKAFDRMGHSQAVVCGIFPDDIVDFPEGVSCYPVFFSEPQKADLLAAPCKAANAAVPRFNASVPCSRHVGYNAVHFDKIPRPHS